MENAYKKASEDIVFEEFDGDLVVLNLASGQYFGLNPSAANVWRVLMDGSIPASPSEAVLACITELDDLGLISKDERAATPVACEITDTPTIDAYDDLSDLIMADPIHDVDNEAGWPVRSDQD